MDELRNILESKGVSKDSKILDICCGDGSLAHKITSFGFTNVKGVDRNLHQLKQHSNKSPIEFLQGDIKDLLQHFEADSVEVILCCRSLHFIDNITEALSIIKTLLSPSGKTLNKTLSYRYFSEIAWIVNIEILSFLSLGVHTNII